MGPSAYRKLLREFLDGRLNAETFMRRFFRLRLSGDAWLSPASAPIADVFVALDAYVPEDDLRGPDDIDEDELRAVTGRSLQRLVEIPDSETRYFSTSRQVIAGLSDHDPDTRAFAAVVARYHPDDPELARALRAQLSDPNRWVRLKAAESVGVLGDVTAFDDLVRLLETAGHDYVPEAEAIAELANREPTLRPRARAALAAWADRHGRQATEQAYRHYLRRIDADG